MRRIFARSAHQIAHKSIAERHNLRHQCGHYHSLGEFFTAMDEKELQKRLELLRTEHRDLDAAIMALTEAGSSDQLQIARLKKRKLRLKDQIAIIEDTLLPDIIA